MPTESTPRRESIVAPRAKLNTEQAANAVGKVAAQLGNRSSQKLELLATCLWIERREGITGEQEILSRLKELKPQYSEQEVQRGLEDARQLAASLAE